MADDDLLTIDQIAPMVGLTVKSASTTHQRAERRRREGKSLTADMPAPDRRIGRSPVWRRDTIERWKATRA
ncbi:hypothetical protein QDA01_gp41 [Microbacterium phage Cinna]|uniref:Helix-turn-helix DNA binding domain protein n=3 Tax=Mementomorivirus TaxID=2733194 RepID=A0A6B9LIJ9_9CAUD|nr:hypothetical protein HOT41_gp44 [Microbacterium phage MementoMori]YP_010750976.1 hypothetical protein QDA00_gp44 [Microbacterium phage Matzah]YP_010751071.1 hypothetical protein QDA01_gp41 [Microbacterium phage Cinna]AWY05319.1 hypothetical protein SEA_MEMENTOMORI_65 [Microbacterium phage MementoMori]QDH91648.1 hypothetical protein PBI_CINNA_64 [Microbacterium phage Cinna]QHB37059.1 hypothetical protein SEA_MATZAH_66 [Microbacterium phage Matzah]